MRVSAQIKPCAYWWNYLNLNLNL